MPISSCDRRPRICTPQAAQHRRCQCKAPFPGSLPRTGSRMGACHICCRCLRGGACRQADVVLADDRRRRWWRRAGRHGPAKPAAPPNRAPLMCSSFWSTCCLQKKKQSSPAAPGSAPAPLGALACLGNGMISPRACTEAAKARSGRPKRLITRRDSAASRAACKSCRCEFKCIILVQQISDQAGKAAGTPTSEQTLPGALVSVAAGCAPQEEVIMRKTYGPVGQQLRRTAVEPPPPLATTAAVAVAAAERSLTAALPLQIVFSNKLRQSTSAAQHVCSCSLRQIC